MKLLPPVLLGFLLLLSHVSSGQDFDVPATLPESKDQFISTEKDLISAAKWLENTPVGNNMDKRKKVNAWVVAWIINSPTVTLEVRASFVKLFEKNGELNIVWMANYARYCLENNYSKDQLRANMAGVKSAINCYNLGGDVKKNKNLSKVIDADKEGKLEDWVREALASK